MYFAQSLLIGSAIYVIAPRNRVLQIQIIVWTIGVILIAAVYGVNDQVLFYSNDQIHYSWVVRIFRDWNWMSETSVDGAKLPFTLAGLPLALVGINETLALKTVSLICLLTLTHLLLNRFNEVRLVSQLKILYFTGCGLIGSFFSLLALRETMMMLFTYHFATAKSVTSRVTSLVVLFLLRPHLAGALVLAELLLILWRLIGLNRRHGFGEVPALLVVGTIIGNFIFIWQLRNATMMDFPLFYQWGLDEATRIASNFVGLQFLTVDRVNFSIANLLWLRILLSETLVIPSVFSLLVLVLNRHSSQRNRLTLLAFAIYVGIATNTDFNSFRQNIPLMPLMGLAILEFFDARARLKPSQTRNSGWSNGTEETNMSSTRAQP
jgi:hypothetical protein